MKLTGTHKPTAQSYPQEPGVVQRTPPVAHSHGAVESLARRYEMWRPHLTERRRRFAGPRWARAVSPASNAPGGSPHRRGARSVTDMSCSKAASGSTSVAVVGSNAESQK